MDEKGFKMKSTLHVSRRKAAMVLHDIEISLGQLIEEQEINLSNMPYHLIEEITLREQKREKNIEIKTVSDVVESTYLDELFSVLLETNKHTSIFPYIAELRNLFIQYNIYEIRNILSHPNRIFKIPYWYKVAAIASDSLIEILGLSNVQKSLYSAEEGIINDPPEDWLNNSFWQISNNLPVQLDHSITGLVGRQKETKEVFNVLKNPRINTIAIVAPGGIGKTALALDLLDKIVKDPSNSSWCELCLFITLKNEALTASGVVKLESSKTIEDIKNTITLEINNLEGSEYEDFESIVNAYSNKKTLLFIDNLETLLVENPSEFQYFNESLPPNWRILITSRIYVGFARVISIDNLQPNMGINLARLYNNRKGGIPLTEEKLERITKGCYFNPLAIRLTLDLINLGNDIPDSLNTVSQEIANFSYKNLIEKLSITSIKILEALFLNAAKNRNDLCELLDVSKESISECISELNNTSLILREYVGDDEVLNLSESIVEFLITNNRNIEIRKEIQEDVTKRKARVKEIEKDQREKNIPNYRWDYLPPDLNENLKITLTKYIKELRSLYLPSKNASKLAVEFNKIDSFYHNDSYFNLAYGKILESMSALKPAISKYDLSININNNNKSSYFFKANALHKLSDYPEAQKLYDDLIDEGYGDIDNIDHLFLTELINMRYTNMLYNHEYNKIIEETKDWKNKKHLRGLFGAFRANAIKRHVESIDNNQPNEKIKNLSRMIKIFTDIFINEELTSKVAFLSKAIFNDLAYYLCIDDYKRDTDFANLALNFIQTYFLDTTEFIKYKDDDSIIKLLKSHLIKSNTPNNPFKKTEWQRFLSQFDSFSEAKALADGYIITKIINCPKNNAGESKGYVFSTCLQEKQYFTHLSRLENRIINEWGNISEGMTLAVKLLSEDQQEKDKALKVREAYIIS